MVRKPIVRFVITPVAVAGILMLAMFAATANGQESNNSGNVRQPSNSAGNGQESNNAGNVQQPSNSTGNGQESNNAGNVQQLSNNAGNRQESNNSGNVQQPSNNTGNAQQPSNNTGNAQQPSNITGNAQADFATTILEIHNRERAAVSVQPLVWNDTLAAGAKTWANHLVATGDESHSGWGGGENIALAGRDARYAVGTTPVPIAQLVGFWVNEKNRNQAVATNDWMTAGHYLQMTSRLAKGVGCGVASGGPQNWDLLVCRYSPAGWDSWVPNQAKGHTSQESNNTGNGP